MVAEIAADGSVKRWVANTTPGDSWESPGAQGCKAMLLYRYSDFSLPHVDERVGVVQSGASNLPFGCAE